MQVLYHEQAKESNTYVVGSCGFDCIPSDCGTVFLQQQFQGDVNSVEIYLELENKGAKSIKFHYGTWQSFVYVLGHAGELRALRSKLYTKSLPKPSFKLPERRSVHYSNIVNGWCVPFPGPDRDVVKRSQYYFFNEEKKRPVQISAYFKVGNIPLSMVIAYGLPIFGFFAKFKASRYLFENYPGFFSAGRITKDEREVVSKDLEFKFTLRGEGWQEKLAEQSDQHSEPPNKTVTVVVSGRNPPHGATCIMLIQAAYTILKEADKLPPKGGVYTPGAAFAKTTLVDRLNATGVSFSVAKNA
jgi:short subunit dehydrogenase-like uncharacterized protein